MTKSDIRRIMLEKGEKFALYLCGAFLLLFVAWGVMAAMDSIAPDVKTEELKTSANTIVQKIGAKAEAEKLPVSLTNPIEPLKPIPTKEYEAKTLLFNPVESSDNKRFNPAVVRLAEISTDVVRLKILAFDIYKDPTDDKKFKIGMISVKGPAGAAPMGGGFAGISTSLRSRNMMASSGSPTMPMSLRGAGGNPGMVGMGMNPAMAAMGMNPAMGGMGMRGNKVPESTLQRMEEKLTYVSLENEDEWKGKRPAQTLYPQQAVVVTASLPYRAQLESIRDALRLDKVDDVLSTPDAVPVFRGVLVDRRTFDRSGRLVADWAPLNYEEAYRQSVYPRAVEDQPEDPLLAEIKLDPRFALVMTLPRILNPGDEDAYKPIRLKTLQDTMANIQKMNKPPVVAKTPNRLQGTGDLYAPRELSNARDLLGYGNPTAGANPANPMAEMPGTINPYGPAGRPRDARLFKPMGETGAPVAGQALDLLDYALVRVIDYAIRPGDRYQYRLRLRMENPNFGKNELMSRSSDATEKELLGDWMETPVKLMGNNAADLTVPGLATIPPENFLFATEPVAEAGKPAPVLKVNQAVLQVQRWVAQIDLGQNSEPVGDWLVANVPVTKGMFVGGKQLIPLPLWSSLNNGFVMREQPLPKGTPTRVAPKKGVEINPIRSGTDLLLVDFTGGKTTRTVGTRTVGDDSSVEMLFLDADGNLMVHSSAIDRQDSTRIKREENWQKWILDVEKATDMRSATSGTGTTPSPFGDR